MDKGTCSIDGCTEDEDRRGWCNKHYLRWYRHGDPLAGAAFLLGHDDRPGERWASVVDYEDRYEISDQGRVRSLSNKGRSGHLLRLSVGGEQEHYRVRLYKGDGGKTHLVHRLVAAAFIGPCPPGMEVRHLDGDYLHNASTNLAYGTHARNMQDMLGHGRGWIARTHCKNGHKWTPANTAYNSSRGTPRRVCKACRRAGRRARKEMREAA